MPVFLHTFNKTPIACPEYLTHAACAQTVQQHKCPDAQTRIRGLEELVYLIGDEPTGLNELARQSSCFGKDGLQAPQLLFLACVQQAGQP